MVIKSDSFFLEPNVGPSWKASGLGYFRDEAGFGRFASAYDDGMALLPPVDDTVAITTSFGRVRAYRFGTRGGSPVVLLAGRQASTPMWRANVASLARHRDVWSVDSVDSVGEAGASTQTAPLRSADDHATWIHETLQGLPADRPHLMGVSIGGWLAAQYALRHPDLLGSVILLDPASTFANLTLQMVVVSLGSVLPGLPQSVRHRLLSRISGGKRSSDDVPEGRLISSGMRDFHLRQPQPTKPTAGQWAAMTAPMLVILGGRSIVHHAERAAAAARQVPGAQVEVLPDASHAINGEYPVEIAERVDTFVEHLPR